MDKEQSKLIPKCELKKDRVGGFPFHILSATHAHQDLHFILAADNVAESLTLYPFTPDLTKLIPATIPLAGILPRKLIATLHIKSLTAKQQNTSVAVQQGEFIIGYRSGQLIVVEYKDKECRVKERYNKSLKAESFMSRASSALFGSEEHYHPYFPSPIRRLELHPSLGTLATVWQVGNFIFLQKQLNEGREAKFLTKYQSLKVEDFYLNYDQNKIIKEGNVYLYGCEEFTAMAHPELSIALLAFKVDVSSFAVLEDKKEIVVSLSSKELIIVIDLANNLVVKTKIETEMPIRRLQAFESGSQSFLLCLPYENYLIVYSLSSHSYCKLRGHKSFIANALFDQSSQRIISAGMDHQIGLIRLGSIQEESWLPAEKLHERRWRVKEYEVREVKFEDLYRLGEPNSTRSNLYSYGYAGLFPFHSHFCFPTYDSKILLYAL